MGIERPKNTETRGEEERGAGAIKVRALLGALVVLALAGFTVGCGSGSDQDQARQGVKEKVKGQQVKKEVEGLRKQVDDLKKEVADLQNTRRCEPVLVARIAAESEAIRAASDPSVATRMLVGKMLMSSPFRSALCYDDVMPVGAIPFTPPCSS